MDEPTIESLQAQLAESTKEIESLKATAASVAAERATEKAAFEKQLEDLKTASAKELEDKLKALSDESAAKAKAEYERGEREMAFKLGSAIKKDDPAQPKTKDELQKKWTEVRDDVFKRARFLKGLSDADKATILNEKKN